MITGLIINASVRSTVTAGFALLLFASSAAPADIDVYESVVSFATTHPKHYTFRDPASGESIIVAVNITPYSTTPGERFAVRGGGTLIGIGMGVDGDYIGENEGVDFTASLVFASTGVITDSVRFRIRSLALQNGAPNPRLVWSSSTTVPPKPFTVGAPDLYPMDALPASLYNAAYTAQLRHEIPGGFYTLNDGAPWTGQSLVLNATFSTTPAHPQANSWLIAYAGRYARIYPDKASMLAGTSVTTWTNASGSLKHSLPAYSGVQAIYWSAESNYIRSTGLASYTMGWWSNSPPFPNVPLNQKLLWRFPRSPSVPTTKTYSPASTIGLFVDGVSMFNAWSGKFWNGLSDTSGPTPGNYGGHWNADAFINEGPTFDAGMGHPESTGTHHYHANPIALRYLLGDHVDHDSVNNTYTEAPNPPTKHSPILGWVNDGFPIYGPYAYANPFDPAAPVTRMRSGYVKRDGTWPGVPSLAASGRNTRPLWAQRLFAAPGGAAVGPAVSATYPVGHYMEDYDYLGDHGYIQGVDFDLDEFNGRWCVTPEFPGGTYAYFVAIDPAGIPAFPYNIGRGYFGTPTGGEETALPGTGLTTNFVGEIHVPLVMAPPAIDAGNVTLTWSAAEGGHYRVERSTDFSSWTTLTTTAPALQTTGSYTTATSSSAEFYRVRRWTFDPFDPVLDIVAPGGTASRGTAIIVRITLPGPVATAQPISWVRLGGSIMAFSFTHPNPTTVIARFIVPPETATGAKDIEIAWELLPLQTLAAAITIN